LTRFEIIFQFPMGWKRGGLPVEMIVGLEGTGNDETSPGDRMGSGCRLGVRRREGVVRLSPG
jgi:hypothetical protein